MAIRDFNRYYTIVLNQVNTLTLKLKEIEKISATEILDPDLQNEINSITKPLIENYQCLTSISSLIKNKSLFTLKKEVKKHERNIKSYEEILNTLDESNFYYKERVLKLKLEESVNLQKLKTHILILNEPNKKYKKKKYYRTINKEFNSIDPEFRIENTIKQNEEILNKINNIINDLK